MTRTRTVPTITRVLLLAATLALALGVLAVGPAAAFVDETADEPADEQAEMTADEPADEHQTAEEDAPASNGNGFVGDDTEAAPVGGVDAGLGGGADQGGPGAAHAAALVLLGLALAGHAANARRVAAERA